MNLKDLEDMHKGKLGFVVGAGPSLHFQDVEPLSNYVTITANSGILKIPDCDYFVSDDEGVRHWNYYRVTAKNSKCTKLLYRAKLGDHIGHFKPEEVLLFDHKSWYEPSKRAWKEGGGTMTKDAEAPIIGARTSLATGLHWAHIMGCDPIVLLGCDCCYKGRNRYFWQFPGETKGYQMNNRPVFSTPNRGLKKNKPVDNHCVDFLEYWKKLAEEAKGVANIIYASEGGILDVFPSMTLVEVLEKYGDRTK